MFPINIDFLNIHNYEGIYFFIAIISGVIFFIYTCKKDNINLDMMFEGVLYSFIAAIIFGRLTDFILWNPAVFLSNPLELLIFWHGGFTVTGAVFGALVTGYVYTKIKKLHFFFHIKYCIPPILIGQVIGRFGCFLNGDCAGIPTNLPWGMEFSHKSVAYLNYFPNFPHLHPTQLYEILGNLILLIFILLTEKNEWITNRRIVFYAIGYGFIRFIVEFFRNDAVRIFKIFTTGQIISFAGILIGVSILIWSIFNDNKMKPEPDKIAYNKI
jgi:phosphatidylglycerol---prolipoprotein diacylglyceryl transferase